MTFTEEQIERAKECNFEFILPNPKRTYPYGRIKLEYCCPFDDHRDSTPSFKVYDDNSWYCFGCSRGGDIIKFIQELTQASFQEAIEYLLNKG